MKIAIFSDTFFPEVNGVANVAYQSAQNLAEAGHEVLVYAPTIHSKEKFKNLREKFKILPLPSVPLLIYPNQRVALPMGLSIFHFIKNGFRPDIIHSHTPFSAGLEAVACAKIFKIPLVGTHHTFYDHYLGHVKLDYPWARKLSWKATVAYYNFCNSVIGPSRALTQELKNKNLKKPIEVVANPISQIFLKTLPTPQEKKGLKNNFGLDKFSVVYMGRLSCEKNIQQVLRAFSLILKEKPEATLMLIGDGPERKKLEKLAVKLGIDEKTVFTGFLNDMKLVQALQANDVFVTASKSENMPLSVLEAMAVGLPVIAVAEKGLTEIVMDNMNGFLVPTDEPEIIAEKIMQIADEPGLMNKFSLASQKEADKYSREEITQKLVELYIRVKKNYENLSLS